MNTTKETTYQNVREFRRLRTWEMHQQGYKQQQIADALDLTQAAVSMIIKRAKAGGVAALRHRKPPGPKARLSPAEQQELLAKLAQGAVAHGFQGDVWTTQRIADFIFQEYGVKYHHDYIGPLLRQLGWSVQRPIVRASQRDEAAIAEWVVTTWPELQKSPSGRAYDSLHR
jgi:transposase